MIYFYRKSLRRVHEYLADDSVLKQSSLKHYGELLISQSTSGMHLALANHFFQSQLKNRIIMMTRDKSPRIAMIKYIALLPIVLLTIALFAFRDGSDRVSSDDKTIIHDSIPGQIYRVVDEMPRFPGCEDSGLTGDELYKCSVQKMLEHVYKHIQYPMKARDQKISGRVVVQFIVRNDGIISQPHVIKSIGFGTDEVVLGVLRSMPQWRPGYQCRAYPACFL
jgi:TonB family protein